VAFLKRKDESTNVIPPAGSEVEVKSNHRPGWLMLLAAVVAILIISTALVFAGRWIYRSVHHKSSNPAVSKPATSKKTPSSQPSSGSSQKSTPSPSPSTNGSTRKTNPAPSPTSPPGSSSNPTSPPTASNQTLPQNGPGNVVALFVGTSLVVAGLHYLINLRRQTE